MAATPTPTNDAAVTSKTQADGVAPASAVASLVVDTNALIRRVRLDELAEKLYTVPEVLAEVRDSDTKNLVENLMVEAITVKEPSREARLAVDAQARKSGDLSALSHCDLQVMALTWQLHCEAKGIVMAAAEAAEPAVPAGREVKATFNNGPLGIAFAPWPTIGSITPGKQAASLSAFGGPNLAPGMVLTAVGGTSVVGMDPERSTVIFKAAKRPVELTFWAPPAPKVAAVAPKEAFKTGAWEAAAAAPAGHIEVPTKLPKAAPETRERRYLFFPGL